MLRARLLLAAGVLLLPATQVLQASPPVGNVLPPPSAVAVNLDTVLKLTFERNAEILTARERVHESQIALDAALQSCMPEMLRKDTFKKSVAEATVWRRRVELRQKEYEILQDAANTYCDWQTALRGEAVARALQKYQEKLLERSRKLAASEKPVQVVVESIETAVQGQQQYIVRTHQQAEALAAKLAYLMGMDGAILTTAETLEAINRVDTSVSVAVLVRQAQDNGPGVQEMQGLIASIQQSIAEAGRAQRCCCRTGAPMICGRLQMAESQLQQAQLSLLNIQLKLRAGVVDAFTAILSGREQIDLASRAIDHAKETYRIMDLRVTEESPEAASRNKTYEGVLNSIRQLSQADSNYLTAVNDYNKAQLRLLLMLGTYTNCPAGAP